MGDEATKSRSTPPDQGLSVLPPETSAELLENLHKRLDKTPSQDELAFRHTGWRSQREMVKVAMAKCLLRSESYRYKPIMNAARYQRFLDCGSITWVMRNEDDPDQIALACNNCGDRFCTPCALARARRLRSKLLDYINGRVLRFVTFTLRTDGLQLDDDMQRLYSGFRRLKQRAFWQKRVTGGIAFCEVKYMPDKQRFHPHFHCLLEGRYMDKKALRREWLAVTGDSFIVDIRIVKDTKKAAEYVSKYITKGYDQSVYESPDVLVETIVALRNRRLVIKLGNWTDLDLSDVASEASWRIVGRLQSVIDAAHRGNVDAYETLTKLGLDVSWDDIRAMRGRSPPAPPPDLLFDYRPVDELATFIASY